MPPGNEIHIFKKGKKIGEAKENSWLGVVDAWEQMNSKAVDYEQIIMKVSFKVVKTNPADPLCMYVFNIEKLNKQVFRRRKVGFYFK